MVGLGAKMYYRDTAELNYVKERDRVERYPCAGFSCSTPLREGHREGTHPPVSKTE